MTVLRSRRSPPTFPLQVFRDFWGEWLHDVANASAVPVDYVAMPLLTSVSALIGHACWAKATDGWAEPPHLWGSVVGDSGTGKSPAADCLFRDVLPVIERRMIGDFPDRLAEWQASSENDKIIKKKWEKDCYAALKANPNQPLPPMPQPTVSEFPPDKPRLMQHDVTIEQLAAILATAAPKGVLYVRDEISGWLMGMGAYNPADRSFWLESYGGRAYRVERRKHAQQAIDIPRLAVAVYGGTQPERLIELMHGPDDGLFSRVQWAWPNPVPFQLNKATTPKVTQAIDALDLLRLLELQPGDPPKPNFIQLTDEAQRLMDQFGRDMEKPRDESSGLLRSAYGKARGTALRLSLVLEYLWWCGTTSPNVPASISKEAFAAAAGMVESYFMPMASCIFSDASATAEERAELSLARWIVKEKPVEVYVRHLLREIRLPGLRNAEAVKKAATALVEANWLKPPPKSVVGQGRTRVAYAVNPKLRNGQ
jgi:hypothetical protein